MKNIVEAIITASDSKKTKEIRCGICGKLLFVAEGNFKKDVDSRSQNVIIVARCTRNSCKTDNRIIL